MNMQVAAVRFKKPASLKRIAGGRAPLPAAAAG